MSDCSNKALLIGKKVHLHHKKDATGRVIGTVSADDLRLNPVLTGIVTGYDSVGMLIEFTDDAIREKIYSAISAVGAMGDDPAETVERAAKAMKAVEKRNGLEPLY